MALTITEAGYVVDVAASSSASQSFAAGITFAEDDMVVVVVGADNAGTNGASSISGVTDDAGHTYTQRVVQNRDPGAANAGITFAIYTAPVGAGGLADTDNITVSFSPNTVHKVAAAFRVTPGAGSTVDYVTSGGNTGSGASPTVTTASVTSGDAVLAGVAVEYNGDLSAHDADSSNGSWSAGIYTYAFTGDFSNWAVLASQAKVATGTATQTYNPTLTVSADYAIGYIVVHEGSGAASITGAAAGTWGTLAGTVAATVKHSATAAGTWGTLAGTVAAGPVRYATATATWGTLTGTAAATVKHLAVAAGTWGTMAATAAAVVTHNAATTGMWGTLTGTVAATRAFTGTAAGTWGTWAGTVSATRSFTGSAAAGWGTLTGTAAATRSFTGAAAGTWGTLAAAAAAIRSFTGTCAATWGTWTGTVAPVVTKSGSAAAAWGTMTGTVAAEVETPAPAGGPRMLVYYAKRHRKKPSG